MTHPTRGFGVVVYSPRAANNNARDIKFSSLSVVGAKVLTVFELLLGHLENLPHPENSDKPKQTVCMRLYLAYATPT